MVEIESNCIYCDDTSLPAHGQLGGGSSKATPQTSEAIDRVRAEFWNEVEDEIAEEQLR